jgi:hypothetical protein
MRESQYERLFDSNKPCTFVNQLSRPSLIDLGKKLTIHKPT